MKKFWPFGLGLGSAGSERKLLSNSSNKGMLPAENHFTVAFVMELPQPESTPLCRAVCIQWLGAMGVQKPGAVITTHDDSPQEVMPQLKMTELRKIPLSFWAPPRAGWGLYSCCTVSQLSVRSSPASSLSFCRCLYQEHSPLNLWHGMLILPLSGLLG